ncbi:uncharacterized protein LOC143910568 isoform X2 [Arctopsyche grandis]
MSHRIIEKRRRDRMNNCLADLSRLIPTDYLKKGRGRIEKTEIIEMAIKHLKYLQEKTNCAEQRENGSISPEHFRLGYQECLSELMRYLVEAQGFFPRDSICVQLINHLHHHCDTIMKGDVINKPRCNIDSNSSSSGSSSNYMTQNQSPVLNMQRPKGKQIEMNINDIHHQHSNIFEEKSTLSTKDKKHSRLASECVNEPSADTTNEPQDVYPERNVSSLCVNDNGGFSGLKLVKGNTDEGGGQNEFLQNNMQSDCQTGQDVRIPNEFSRSPYHYQRDHCELNLRSIREKGDSSQLVDSGLSSNQGDNDNLHSYKFKNNIKKRFSQSQSTDYLSSSPSDSTTNVNLYNRNEFVRRDQYAANGKLSYKKRKIGSEHQPRRINDCYDNNQISSSETNSSENNTSVSQNSEYQLKDAPEEDMPNYVEYHQMDQNAPNIIRQKKNYNNHGEKIENKFPKFSGVGVPIFALHAKGSFYVPLNIDYESLIPFLGPYDLLDATCLDTNISLHPVTISVNCQPIHYNKHVSVRTKSELKDWQ